MDQQAKQTLHFSGGVSIGNYDGKLLVASASAIYSVLPIPLETQLQNLLEKGKVEEALELAEGQNSQQPQENHRFQLTLNLVRQKAAFICFEKPFVVVSSENRDDGMMAAFSSFN